MGRTGDELGGLSESSGPVLRGVIEGIPDRGPSAGEGARGRLVRLEADGRAETVWQSNREGIFSVMARGDALYFGSGEPARLYRVDERGEVARVATSGEAQVTALLGNRSTIWLATSNPAAAYRLSPGSEGSAVFVSAAFDAGATARWGAIRWGLDETPAADGRVELYTRTGNSREPDVTWSGWSPALTDPARSRVVNPDGRYLQWRARFVASAKARRGWTA